MTKSTKKISLFLILSLFSVILVGCGNKNLTNKQNSTGNTTMKTNLPLTMAELSLHNSATDCWQLINGQIYDLSAYTSSSAHPGGSTILQGCGQDATALFNSIGKHGGKAQAMLPNFLLGPIQL